MVRRSKVRSKEQCPSYNSWLWHKHCLAEATKNQRQYDMNFHQKAVDRYARHIKRYWPRIWNEMVYERLCE